jgi:hypothetical protein
VARIVNACWLMLIASLLGCSTLSEKQCKTANWAQLGERDAYEGYGRERLYDHQKACSEYSVAPQTVAYNEGWDKGIRLYCTPQRGFDVGKTGASYRRTCPPELEAGFQRGFDTGQGLYRESKHSDQLRRDIQTYEDKLKVSNDANERDNLRRKIRDLDDEALAAQRRMRRLQDDAGAMGVY